MLDGIESFYVLEHDAGGSNALSAYLHGITGHFLSFLIFLTCYIAFASSPKNHNPRRKSAMPTT